MRHCPKWLAVGDAANAFDPLSGQGIYKAVQSGILAAKMIIEHLSGNALASAEYDEAMKQEYARYLQLHRTNSTDRATTDDGPVNAFFVDGVIELYVIPM